MTIITVFILVVILLLYSQQLLAFNIQQPQGQCSISRREAFVTATVGLLSAAGVSTAVSPCVAAVMTKSTQQQQQQRSTPLEEKVSSVASLIAVIPNMPFGAPATNATLSASVVFEIESLVSALELNNVQGMKNLATSPNLSGNWRLIYSNAPEINNLATGLPLGFVLGPTYQPLELLDNTNRFENRGLVLHRFGLAKLESIVVGNVNVASPGTLNAVGVVNNNGNRVDVNFQCILFQLDELFGFWTFNPPIRKVILPKLDSNADAQPANDITYLDAKTRIVRGGDGSLFVFIREEEDADKTSSTATMFTIEERDALLLQGTKSNSGDQPAIVGIGDAQDKAQQQRQKQQPAELKFLLKQ